MITLHLIFTIIIVNNLLNQKVEESLDGKVIIRTGMMALVYLLLNCSFFRSFTRSYYLYILK
ncbi:hypothetical protein Mgra_00004259 [Meloidogyne graminicola]|uniref:Uncharacterized protein n=1 Tax=Meloidogyne graminicola TaxID=189291 RepID=A0A8S9ZRN2_9BILA|nr:hypothetical protein Mgra_00004259 [Meloidogyne graminicola]